MKQSRLIPHLSLVLIVALISTLLLQNITYAAEGSTPIVPVSNVSNPSITWNDTGNHPRMLQGALSSSVRGESEIYSYLANNKKLYGFSSPQNDLNVIKKDSDSQGKQHYLLQQSYKGIPVYGKYMRAHVDSSNQLYAITNQSIPELNDITLDTTPAISSSQASAALVTAVEQAIGQPITLGGNIGPRQLTDPTAELIIYPVDNQYLLAYRVKLEYLQPSYNQWDGFIDANTGAVLNKNSQLEHFDAIGIGTGFYNDKKMLNIFQETNGSYNLQDKTKPMYQNINNLETGVIATYDIQKQFEGPVWSNSVFFTDSDAVDAHYNAGLVYDYYRDKLNRNSIDDNGMDILSYVNVGAIDNAYWDGYEMLYGDGSTTFSCLSCALDVVAHELTHGVTQYTAGLDYSFQSGALNESLSDIMGVVIENKDWTIGETTGITGGNRVLRDLQTPSRGLDPQPSIMSDFKVLPLSIDNGGVHTNSGIPNHAAYLIGTGIDQISGLQGQGKTLLGQIVYGAMTSYLTPTSNFIDARDAFVLAAGDLTTVADNLKPALIQAVKDAWAAVGLGYANTISNNIVYFKTPNMVGEPAINSTTHTVTFQVTTGTSLNNLTPVITVSPGATITPDASVAKDFTSPVSYRVRSNLGAEQIWTIQGFVVPAIRDNDILDFEVDQQTGPAVIDRINHRVTFYVESDVDVTALIPTINVTQNATILPASETPVNLNNPVTYMVTAQNGTSQAWLVTAIQDSISPKLASASSINNNQITLIFNKAMDSASLNNSVNYQIKSLDPSISAPSITGIVVDCVTFDRVTLNTSNLVSDNKYKVTVSTGSSTLGYSIRPDWNTGYFLVADTKAPVLSTKIIMGTQLVLTFNEYIKPSSAVLASLIQVKVNGSLAAVKNTSIASRKITVTLSQPVLPTDNIVITYNKDNAVAIIQDLHENQYPSFNNLQVLNRTAPPIILGSAGSFYYNKPLKQMIKHPNQPIVYSIFENSNLVISANMDTGATKTITMDRVPVRLFYADNKIYVALTDKPHNDDWQESDQTGSIAILNADSLAKANQFKIDSDPYDLVVDKVGNIYVTSGSGQNTYLKSYSGADGTNLSATPIRQLSYMVYNSTINRIYTITTDEYDRTIRSFHIDTNGNFIMSNDSSTQDTYPLLKLLRVSPDNRFLFNSFGSVIYSSDQYIDLKLAQTIDGFDDIAFDSVLEKFYTIKNDILKVYNYSGNNILQQITLPQAASTILMGSHPNELLIAYSRNGGDSTSVVSTYVQSNGNALAANTQAGFSLPAPTNLVQALNVNPCAPATVPTPSPAPVVDTTPPGGSTGGTPPTGGGPTGGPPPAGGGAPPPAGDGSATPTATPTPTPAAPKGTPSPTGQMGKDDLVVEHQTDAFGKTSSNIKPNVEKLLDALKSAQSGSEQYEKENNAAIVPSIVIPVDGTSDRANVEIPAKLFADANQQAPNAVIIMKSDLASYTLPVQLLTSQAMKTFFGDSFDITNSKINMTIEKANDSLSNQIKQKMASDGYTTLSDSINFTLSVESNGKTVEIIDLHGTYVVRSIVLSTNVNTASVSALVFDPITNESSFVPALVRVEAGKTIVDIKSPHNSIYTLVDASKTFDDIAHHWAKDDIEIMASKKIVLGTTARTFMPEQLITRAEFATFLVRTLSLLLPQPNINFKDVNTKDWYARSVAAAVQAGLVTGYADGTFAPNGTITRQEMAVMISRAMKYAGGAQTIIRSAPPVSRLNTFKDSSKVPSWAADDIEQLLANGVMAGISKTQFEPTASVTRAQAVTALKHMLQQLKFIN
ncbi:hypothetical protein EHS13_34440 [Paenibacillus psychroresistens]|uniref:SLH domain-containing protein n=1 Tax=Paenibacillus psychroresistens TaxID=1778678 RepID=A0A6B8RUT5_9BACL|nr:S-layer homology domain-containing protein [Paenibacillus psychroresistens]QGQ99602.1 hypothetical protein EHS13_34440 [Paenibacillus psychroresistens]